MASLARIHRHFKQIRPFYFSIKPFSTTISQKTNQTPQKSSKCCSVKKPAIVELGQPSVWTHPHLFDADPDQVTPGITKNEFSNRRDSYVKNLSNYQMFYFSSKLSQSEKIKLQQANEKWTESGFNKINHNFIAVIPSAMTMFLAPDVPHMFKQNSDFLYLTGFKEPNSVLVISKTDASSSYKTALFVKERDPKKELWEGPCTGPDNISRLCGIENAYPTSEFKSYLNSLVKETHVSKKITLWRYPTDHVKSESGPDCENPTLENELNEFVEENQATSSKLIDMAEQDALNGSIAASYYNSSRYFIQMLRTKKSKAELDIMRKACDISGEAFINSMNITHPFINEHLIHSKFDFDCKIRGADHLAYIPVIAGGNRATTLHYIRNNQIVTGDSLLLMDAGCEYRDYAADITRTWPVSGKFTSAQKDLYQACLNVQMYCIEKCQPGVTLQDLYTFMMRKLGEELNNLGLIDKRLHEAVVKQSSTPNQRLPMNYIQAVSSFCAHDIGHFLGIDVHDSPEVTKMLKLEPGSVITIEPGIYIRADNQNVPEKYRGIGIRIEDDVAITSTGFDVLSKRTPKAVDEIESLLRRNV